MTNLNYSSKKKEKKDKHNEHMSVTANKQWPTRLLQPSPPPVVPAQVLTRTTGVSDTPWYKRTWFIITIIIVIVIIIGLIIFFMVKSKSNTKETLSEPEPEPELAPAPAPAPKPRPQKPTLAKRVVETYEDNNNYDNDNNYYE